MSFPARSPELGGLTVQMASPLFGMQAGALLNCMGGCGGEAATRGRFSLQGERKVGAVAGNPAARPLERRRSMFVFAPTQLPER